MVRVIITIQLKQYDQQYNQDKSKGGNSYIVNNIYTSLKNLSKDPILEGWKKINNRAILYNIQ